MRLATILIVLSLVNTAAAEKPNIVFILADDLGYGDVGCYNPESKVPTPNLDSLARKGKLFTDAHSPSTVCSPSRYSLITGRNAFRVGFTGVFSGVGGPSMIEDSRLTLPAMLRDYGYTTACFGKWHVGMTFYDKEGKQLYEGTPGKPEKFDWKVALDKVRATDFSRSIPDGPIDRGFDHFFGTVSCPTTDWLYAFVEGDRVPVPPTGILDKSTLPDHVYSTDCREGMIAPGFDLEEVDMVFLKKSQEFIENHAKHTPKTPFFLLHTTQAVHLPSFPGSDFRGKTKAGPHGDFIFEFDHIVGELMKTLEDAGFGDNTLVMVSSDNGPETISAKDMRETYNHDGARPWRGVKRDQWEGGHRVPFIAYWPGKIKADSRTDQTVCLTDVMATCAAIVGFELPNDAAEDSIDILPVLLGEQSEEESIRSYTLHETLTHALAIRKGQWKYLDHKGAGSNNYNRKGIWGMEDYALPERYPDAPGQLYNLKDDPGETNNLYYDYPEIVEELKARLEIYKQSGRSAPNRSQNIVFSTDFSGTEFPPEIIPKFKTRWSVEDGVLVGQPATSEQQQKNKEAGPGHFGHNASMTVLSQFEDAVVEYSFRFEEDACTVVFVNNAPGRSHLFNLNLASNKASVMRFQDKKVKGDEKKILTEVPVHLPARKWHKVKVVMHGATVTVWVNGKEILSVSDDRFAGSKHDPNFRTAGPAVLQLDNIIIRN